MNASTEFPAIVVPVFNRVQTLNRLMESLKRAHFPAGQITLNVSVEGECDPAVAEYVRALVWPHGELVVEWQEKRLGLRAHLLHCGGLSAKYGAVIVLEDDLVVGEGFYEYAQQALKFSESEPKIAGIALYRYHVAEHCGLPFQVQSETDDFYLQVPCSWGQAWTASQWQKFRDWDEKYAESEVDEWVPDYMKSWGLQSWKKRFAAYLIANERFVHYPLEAHSSNPGSIGTHTDRSGVFQVPLGIRKANPYDFGKWEGHRAVFDAYFELMPHCLVDVIPEIDRQEVVIDLLGQKPHSLLQKGKWVLSTRTCSDPFAKSWAVQVLPLWDNLQFPISPGPIALAAAGSFAEAKSKVSRMHRLMGSCSVLFRSVSIIVPAIVDVSTIRMHLEVILREFVVVEILLVGHAELLEKWKLDWPHVRKIDAGKGTVWQSIIAGLQAATGDLITCIPVGADLEHGAGDTILELFEGHSEMKWLLAKPKHSPLHLFRWDAMKFNRSSHQVRQLGFPFSAMVWQRDLLQAVLATGAQQPLEIVRAALQMGTLHTAVDAWIGEKHGLEGETISQTSAFVTNADTGIRAFSAKITAWAYRMDIPLIRQIHLGFSKYPGVLRKSDSGDWFRSEY